MRTTLAVLFSSLLAGAVLGDVTLAGAHCANADFAGARVSGSDLEATRLAGADLRQAIFEETVLEAVDLRATAFGSTSAVTGVSPEMAAAMASGLTSAVAVGSAASVPASTLASRADGSGLPPVRSGTFGRSTGSTSLPATASSPGTMVPSGRTVTVRTLRLASPPSVSASASPERRPPTR